MYFFKIIELFPLPVRLSLLKYLLWEKYGNYCYYPLTTAQDDRFATGCEKIVSWPQNAHILLSTFFSLFLFLNVGCENGSTQLNKLFLNDIGRKEEKN